MEMVASKIIFQKHQVYKDSGLAWLGLIPEEWNLLPAKRFHKVSKELNKKRSCDNVLSLTLRGVVNNDLDNPEGLVPKDYATYQIFEKNDLVFKLIDLENISTSRVGLVHEKGIMSSAYIRLVTGDECHPKYAYYYYFSLYINEVFNKLGNGVRSTLGPNDLLNLPFLKPTFQEQRAIANFLDDKTTKIDQAIVQKGKIISLLKERKQGFIQKVLIKGINQDKELKNSNVDYIGQIPKHWKVKRLKYVLKERNERSTTGEETLFMVSQVHGLVVRSEFHSKAEVAETSVGNKIVYENDLVFNKLKAHLGVFFKSIIKEQGLVSPDYAVYYSNDEIDNLKYLELLFRHPAYIGQFIIKATGIVEGLIRLYTDDLFSISVPIPPMSEQKEILNVINQYSDKIDKSIFKEQKQIDKLKEYKTTLIDSAVTGKIKIN